MRNIGLVACAHVQMHGPPPAIADQMQLRIQPAFGPADSAPATGLFFNTIGSDTVGFDAARINHQRAQVGGAFPDAQSCLSMAAARLRHIAGTKWSTRHYMNMDLLKQMETNTRADTA